MRLQDLVQEHVVNFATALRETSKGRLQPKIEEGQLRIPMVTSRLKGEKVPTKLGLDILLLQLGKGLADTSIREGFDEAYALRFRKFYKGLKDNLKKTHNIIVSHGIDIKSRKPDSPIDVDPREGYEKINFDLVIKLRKAKTK